MELLVRSMFETKRDKQVQRYECLLQRWSEMMKKKKTGEAEDEGG